MILSRLLRFTSVSLLATLTVISTEAVLAQKTAHFDSLSLSPGFPASDGTVTGYTGGSYSLSTIANRDRQNHLCIGFAAPTPDHTMVLKKNFSHLKLLVNSGSADTTLLIQGPEDDTIRCGDDSANTKDASVDDSNWKSGTYHIWVGTFNPGVRRNYTLSVQE